MYRKNESILIQIPTHVNYLFFVMLNGEGGTHSYNFGTSARC